MVLDMKQKRKMEGQTGVGTKTFSDKIRIIPGSVEEEEGHHPATSICLNDEE